MIFLSVKIFFTLFILYILSKISGELLCDCLQDKYSNLEIDVDRLPRLATDQNLSLMDDPLDSPLNYLIRILNISPS